MATLACSRLATPTLRGGNFVTIQVDTTDASGQVTTIFQTINVGPITVTVSPNPVYLAGQCYPAVRCQCGERDGHNGNLAGEWNCRR